MGVSHVRQRQQRQRQRRQQQDIHLPAPRSSPAHLFIGASCQQYVHHSTLPLPRPSPPLPPTASPGHVCSQAGYMPQCWDSSPMPHQGEGTGAVASPKPNRAEGHPSEFCSVMVSCQGEILCIFCITFAVLYMHMV